MNTQATEQKDAESQNATKKQEQAPTLHEQYARAVSGSYLTGLCNNKEGCIFVITYKDFNDAEFDIYSFQNFQQSDGVNTVVDIIGSGCSIKNAKQHRVIAKGKCQKNQDLWEVTKNLKIEIS